MIFTPWARCGPARRARHTPTFIRTPVTGETFRNPDRVAWIMEKIKLDRIGEVTDIMGPVVYLASDAGACTTGEIIRVDGGYHILGMPQIGNIG